MIRNTTVECVCDACEKPTAIDNFQQADTELQDMKLPPGYLAMYRIASERRHGSSRRTLMHACGEACFTKLAIAWLLAEGLEADESPRHAVERVVRGQK